MHIKCTFNVHSMHSHVCIVPVRFLYLVVRVYVLLLSVLCNPPDSLVPPPASRQHHPHNPLTRNHSEHSTTCMYFQCNLNVYVMNI